MSKSAIHLAVERVCETLGPNPSLGKLEVKSYKSDLAELWKWCDPEITKTRSESQGEHGKTLVIVCDKSVADLRSGPVPIEKYVTPFDWVVALHLNWYRNKTKDARLPHIILAVDSKLYEDTTGYSYFAQFPQGWSPILPNVFVCELPGSAGRFPSLIELVIGELRKNQQDAGAEPKESAVERADRFNYLLGRQWAAFLSQPERAGDHHAIANLLGPQSLLAAGGLSRQQDRDQSDGLLPQLRVLLDAVGNCCATKDHKEGEEKGAGTAFPIVPREVWEKSIDRFILIDDLHEAGWREFLAEALDSRNLPDKLRAIDDPSRRCFGPRGDQSLFELIKDKNGGLEINHDINLTGATREVIILDLRLFAGKSAEEEFEFYWKLLELAKTIPENKKLIWPGFTKTELEDIGKCIKNKTRESGAYFDMLTLLPRMLSLVNPYRPIVLYSSTGQRRIVKSLSRYGNIVLDFQKPTIERILQSQSVEYDMTGFKAAIYAAIGRSKLESLVRTIALEREIPTKWKSNEECINPWVCIYVEESGKYQEGEPFVVTAVVAIFNGQWHEEDCCRTLVNSFDGDFPLVWGLSDNMDDFVLKMKRVKESLNDPDASLPFTPKYPYRYFNNDFGETKCYYQDGFVEVAAQMKDRDPGLLVCSLMQHGGIVGSGDILYHTLLRELLEMIVLRVLPQFFGEVSKIDLCVDIATRLGEAIKVEVMHGLTRNFGLRRVENQPDSQFLYYSFNTNSAYPLVGEIMQSRKLDSVRLVLRRARGVVLRDFENLAKKEDEYLSELPNRNPLPKQIHYCADWASKCSRYIEEDRPEMFKTWLSNGFMESKKEDQLWENVSESCRLAEKGNFAEALWKIRNVYHECEANQQYGVHRWIWPYLWKECVVKLGPNDLNELFDRFTSEVKHSEQEKAQSY